MAEKVISKFLSGSRIGRTVENDYPNMYVHIIVKQFLKELLANQAS